MSENCFNMEQEVEFLVPVSNGYPIGHTVGGMGESAKIQDGENRRLSI